MNSDANFSSIDFRGLSKKEQIAKCREMAREAEGFALIANGEKARRVRRSRDAVFGPRR